MVSASDRDYDENSNANNAGRATRSGPASAHSSQQANVTLNMWQHPFVDVFKQFKILPVQDWKVNKRQGDVSEIFVSF